MVGWRMDGREMEVASIQRRQKRHADDNLATEQRLAKRLHALNLGTLVASNFLTTVLTVTSREPWNLLQTCPRACAAQRKGC